MGDVAIGYVDGSRLRLALIAGGTRLIRYREQLNQINVFPVADSDTGSNMAGTVAAVVRRLKTSKERSLAAVSRMTAEAAIQGARGNSGAILAQFFVGLSAEIGDRASVTGEAFARAADGAVKYAVSAISAPREGTILTVLRSWGTTLREGTRLHRDLYRSFAEALSAANQALKETTALLPALRKANVVDAGALGFVRMIEGVHRLMIHGPKEVEDSGLPEDTPEFHLDHGDATEAPRYRYCTEGLLTELAVAPSELTAVIEEFGDSVVVVGTRDLARVHIHTDTPGNVFQRLARNATLTEHKVDDMKKQYDVARQVHGRVGFVVDSACDAPQELLDRPDVAIVPLTVSFGDQVFLDKVGLSPEGFYEELRREDAIWPKTAQPSVGEFSRSFEFIGRHFPAVLSLNLAAALSGTIDSARTAEKSVDGSVSVVDSRGVSVGIGLILRRLVEAADQGADLEELRRLAEEAAENVSTLVVAPSVEAMVKGGRVSSFSGMIARALGICPFVTLDDEGKAKAIGLSLSFEAGIRKLLSSLEKRVTGPTEFAVAHVDNRETALRVKEAIEARFEVSKEIFIRDASPVLAAHTGPGTVGVMFLPALP